MGRAKRGKRSLGGARLHYDWSKSMVSVIAAPMASQEVQKLHSEHFHVRNSFVNFVMGFKVRICRSQIGCEIYEALSLQFRSKVIPSS